MRSYTASELRSALEEAGLRSGDLLLLHCNLFTPGRMEGVTLREEFYGAVVGAFRDVLGPQGTLVLPCHTPQCPRFGTDFVLEETPSITGSLGEYLRKAPGSRRSLHPLNSYVIVGHHADELCRDPALNGWGEDSVPGRMLRMGAKGMILGGEIVDHPRIFSLTWHHWLECVAGVPYNYNKLLNVAVFAEGKRVDRDWSSSVRYLDLEVSHDMTVLHRRMIAKGHWTSVAIGGSSIHLTSSVEYCNEGLSLLAEDVHGFLEERPQYVPGHVPFDGTTSGRPGDISRAGLNED